MAGTSQKILSSINLIEIFNFEFFFILIVHTYGKTQIEKQNTTEASEREGGLIARAISSRQTIMCFYS